jgi:asparagine synthase (glutamine-hydrolysing)
MLDILDDPSSPLQPYVNKDKLRAIASTDQDQFNIPWFGQLMNTPQLFAYLCQVDYWLRKYRIQSK